MARRRRGVEIDWQEWQAFESREDFETSEIPALLKTVFTLRSGKATSSQVYHCRHARKKGFNCGTKVKVVFSEVDDGVTVALCLFMWLFILFISCAFVVAPFASKGFLTRVGKDVRL